MANENVKYNTRIQLKHDTEANWIKAVNFTPKAGEIIIYNADDTNPIRFKVGDDKTLVNDLPFYDVSKDWEQNDETSLSFIKNRTHYVSDNLIDVTIIEEQTMNTGYAESVGYPCGYDEFDTKGKIVEGQTYTVVFNGTEYECVAYKTNGHIGIGNDFIYDESQDDNNEPFFIEQWDDDISSGYATVYSLTIEPHIISVTTKEKEVIKLPSKYLLNSNILNGENLGSVKVIGSTADGQWSFAEGYSTAASGDNSHAEGNGTTSAGINSHAEGCGTISSGMDSHTEGLGTKTDGNYSHAEGRETTAQTHGAHAEGYSTVAAGEYSHTEGYETCAAGIAAHAEGRGTYASGDDQHVQGRWNIEDSLQYAHIVGNGTDETASNAYTLDWDGNAWFAGDVYVGSISGTNKDDGSKKLATEEYVDNKFITGIKLTDTVTGEKYIIEIQNGSLITRRDISGNLEDFEYTQNADGNYKLTGWKETQNGESSTEMILPGGPNIIL